MNKAFEKFDLTGKTALITGGAAGIGYHMAKALAQSGAKVMIAARRESLLKESADKLTIECDGNQVLYYKVDLASRSSIAELSEYAINTMGGVDIFIGNAAQNIPAPIEEIKDETLDYMMQMNVSANIQLFRSFLPGMRKNKWGRVIFISSVTSIASSSQDGTSVYVAAKGALNAFTRNAAAETGHGGITVNTLVLGLFYTDIVQQAMDYHEKLHGSGAGKKFVDNLSSMTSIGRPCLCEEIEGVIQLLASNAGSIITGTNTIVDGGMSIMLRPNPVS